MTTRQYILFTIPSLIWGSTWYAILLKGKIKADVNLAAILGVSGTYFLFQNELKTIKLNSNASIVSLFCLGGIILASLGNIISAYNQKKKIAVIQANAFGMLYGGITMFIFSLIHRKPIQIESTFNYLSSLIYLAIFGSIIAFSTYLKLLGEIGPDRSIYIALITPTIAMLISTIFEAYQWDISALMGIVLLLSGNILALRFKQKKVIA